MMVHRVGTILQELLRFSKNNIWVYLLHSFTMVGEPNINFSVARFWAIANMNQVLNRPV